MAKESLQRHSLTLRGSEASSGEASAWARGLAAQVNLPEDRTFALDLCIVEIVTNIVDHCYAGKPGVIQLDLDLGREVAVVAIIDEGPAFDPLALPPPAKPTSIEDARIGGYGVHMVRSTADRCRYERRDGRNVFTAFFGSAD